MSPRIGVLALQGDVREHVTVLHGLGVDTIDVRRASQLDDADALVLPGGESHVIDRLLRTLGMHARLAARIADGMPVLGTCAGLILLASRVLDAVDGQRSLGALDVDVRRNAFGSQVDSFERDVHVPVLDPPVTRAAFIRAPVVERVGEGVSVLATIGDRVIGVEQGAVQGIAFHPEVSGESRFHARLVERCR